VEILPKVYDPTAAVFAAVTSWDAASPCAGWTVRDVANHLVGALRVFAAAVDGGEVADGDYLGDDPLGAFLSAADRCLVLFSRPEVLAASHPFPFGPTPGTEIAEISVSESLVHGWDIARGAGVPYSPAPEAVAHVLSRTEDMTPPAEDMFALPVPAPAGAAPLTVLLARLGRTA
jgi:uncharacterized protein (TIGR03086 family)